MKYTEESVADIVRQEISSNLAKILIPLGYRIESSSISIRIYKDNCKVASLWLYRKDLYLKMRVRGKPIKEKLGYDDPNFFDKVNDKLVKELCL